MTKIFSRSSLAIAACVISACAIDKPQPTPATPSTKPIVTAPIGVAAFNMAWAGTMADFNRHVEVCANPAVNWCETRTRTLRGASAPTAEEALRAKTCQEATLALSRGQDASTLMAPCNAYRSGQPTAPGAPPENPNLTRTPAAYQVKLDSLRETVEGLIKRENVKVIAFQEVRSAEVIRVVLGKYADKFAVCDAKHNAFQTLAFAWEMSLTSKPGDCTTESQLAIKDPPNDPTAFRRVRPGLRLSLTINNQNVTFMNVHLKAGCASVNNSDARYPSRLLTDANDACEVFNRQVPILESWIETVAAASPRFVLLGDFNRRIDDEMAMNIDKSQVRADGTDPASVNNVAANGKVTTRYLWQEISDGSPLLHQIPLSTKDGGCTGFQGLDPIVISDALKKLNSGQIQSQKIGVVTKPGQTIETSDHCPRVVKLNL